jgi:excisionase family DNA binding protein
MSQTALNPKPKKMANRETRILPSQRYLAASDVAELYGVSLPTVWRLVRQGKLPAPDLRTGRIVRWRPEQFTKASSA